MKAADTLAGEGIAARVIDLYLVKPLDVATLERAAKETRGLITVEDHSVCGGLGEAISAALRGASRVQIVGVNEIPRSGKPDELMAHHGLSADAIAAAARELAKS